MPRKARCLVVKYLSFCCLYETQVQKCSVVSSFCLRTVMLLSFIFILTLVYYISPLQQIVLEKALENVSCFTKREKMQDMQKRLPQVIIIGVRKCGTRALLEMLNLHPSIKKSTSEIHYFDDDEQYSKGLAWYKEKMPFTYPYQVTIEKTPSYFISKEAPARIKKMNETIKLVIIVREPATRVLSDYTQIAESKKTKSLSVLPFKKKVLNSDGEINERYKAIKISQYAVHLTRWLREFLFDQIHIVDGDKLINDPYHEVKKIEDFLSLPLSISRDQFYFNETKGFYCFIHKNRVHRKCLANGKGRPHPAVDQKIMSRLRQYFEPFNEQFYIMVKHNFSWPTS